MALTLSPRRAAGPVGEAPPSASLLRKHRTFVLVFHRGLAAATLGPPPGLQQVEKLANHSEDDEQNLEFPSESHLVNHSEDDEKKLDLPSETHLVNHSVDDETMLANHSEDDETKFAFLLKRRW